MVRAEVEDTEFAGLSGALLRVSGLSDLPDPFIHGVGCIKEVKSHFMLFIGLGNLPATPQGLVLKVSSAATLGLRKSIEDVIKDTVRLHFSSSKLVYIH